MGGFISFTDAKWFPMKDLYQPELCLAYLGSAGRHILGLHRRRFNGKGEGGVGSREVLEIFVKMTEGQWPSE